MFYFLTKKCGALCQPVVGWMLGGVSTAQLLSTMVLLWSLLATALTIVQAKKDYETKSFRGFYNDRICGTVFTDRCRDHSKRIICGSNYCAELAPYHAVLNMKTRLGSNRFRRDGSRRVVDSGGPKKFQVKNKEWHYDLSASSDLRNKSFEQLC